MDATKLKSYNLNKFTPYDSNFDCLHSTRKNISIPPEFSLCFRHKKIQDGIFWGSIFVGNVGANWRSQEMGFEYLNWNYSPWLAITRPGVDKRSWVPMGESFDFNMLTWRHTCITLDIVSGASIVFENGKLLSENVFDPLKKFGSLVPDFVANMITVGCLFSSDLEETHSDPGSVTDFHIFGRILSQQELQQWTGCEKRLLGDIVNWETENWFFNKTGNGSEVEYLEFEKEVCDMQEKSFHLFPVKTTFRNALDVCDKVSGQLNT